MKSLSGKRLRNAAVTLSFLPPTVILLYVVFLFTIDITEIYRFFKPIGFIGITIFGIVWSSFAVIFAWIALRHSRAGGILIVFAGGLFFVTALISNHYVQIYLPASGIYFVGGIIHLYQAFIGRA